MKEYVTWTDIEDYIDGIVKEVKDKDYKGIFTFPRGGLILATLLSYRLDLPILTSPCDNCIIIDDICDTGITLKKYSDMKDKKNYFITTMYIQEDQLKHEALYQCTVDYYKNVKQDIWVVYPWEEKVD